MTTKINASTSGLTESVDTSGILEIQTDGQTAIIIGANQNANFATTGAITVPVGTTAQRPTPVNGMMRYNSNVAVFEVYANNIWSAANVTPAPVNTVAPVISGSAVVGQNLTSTTGTWSGTPTSYFYQWRANSTSISNATANVFTLTSTQTGANITCNVIAQNIAGNSSPATSNTLGPVVLGTTVNYLIVAGGGGGGFAMAGGGGAGGMQTGTTILQPANTYAITIGAGGVGASSTSVSGVNGSNSSIAGLTASVGGGGGGSQVSNGVTGGSGGGAGSGSGRTAGSGTSGQGFAGGAGTGSDSGNRGGGGGGGAGAVGAASAGGGGGNGGAGNTSSITGTSTYYAGGGGGGCGRSTGTAGTGGLGGGGSGVNDGSNATNGTANTGGGGGGGGESSGFADGIPGTGGSGIVIISYAGAQQFGGGVVSTDGSNTIHTFYTSGSLVPLTALSANYLTIGGGGGGGCLLGGGGGAGGLLSGSNVTIDSSSTYVITVGAGGAGSTSDSADGIQGANSTFSAVATTASGGGGGGSNAVPNGSSGASGGGAAGAGGGGTGGAATQGFAGGNSPASSPYPAGGGGGSSAVGAAGSGSASGAGGAGTASSISGSSVTYTGGGGGSGNTTFGASAGAGGSGGGGAGGNSSTSGSNATLNTGSGGGGGGTAGGSGGSGVVIVTYPGSTPQMAGGNVTVVSNTVVHTFTSSGYLTPFVLSTNSLRFRLSGPAKLTRTPTVSSSTLTKITYSAWIKRGKLGTYQSIYGGYIPTGPTNDCVRFNSSDQIEFNIVGGSVGYLATTAVYRDPAAWYHIVAALDTTQAVANDRMKLWVNGVQVPNTPSPSPSQNYNLTGWNNVGKVQNLGTDTDGSSFPFDGYMAEVRSIDGQALTPNSFGTFNQYGVWQPVAYAGSYGTNGFYLPFTNTANTTALGYDFSPQGNNWTTNNISVTAGATYDAMTDVPTLTSANVANFAVINVLDQARGSFTTQNANLQFTATATNASCAMTMFPTTGKWYAEAIFTTGGDNYYSVVGIIRAGTTAQWYSSGVYYSSQGYKYVDGTSTAGFGATWTTGETIGVALDIDGGTVAFYKQNSLQGTITLPSSTTGWTFSLGDSHTGGGSVGSINCGQQPYTYTAPSGFVALNTYNL